MIVKDAFGHMMSGAYFICGGGITLAALTWWIAAHHPDPLWAILYYEVAGGSAGIGLGALLLGWFLQYRLIKEFRPLAEHYRNGSSHDC